MLVLVLVACGVGDDPGFSAGGARSDADLGGAGGGGDDTGTDTAGDTGGDTGDVGEIVCDGADLVFAVQAEDSAGTVGTAFSWPAEIVTRATFVNPCAGTLQWVTPTSCVVDTWTLTDDAGGDTTFSGNCVDSETTWTLRVGEGTSVTAEWGSLDRGNWQVSAASAAVGRTASEFFSVQ